MEKMEYYLADLVFLLRERGAEARAERTKGAFEAGRALAYFEVLDLMQHQAEAFSIPLESIQLDGFDPANQITVPSTTSDIAIYTIMLEFRGGTYVDQIASTSPEKALRDWAQKLHPKIEMTEAERHEFRDDLDYEPVPLEGVRSIWCDSALVNDDLALVNIIRTKV